VRPARALAVALAIAAIVSASAEARRAPTVAERAEIRGATALALSDAPPACYTAVIHVSTVNPSYAYSTPRWKTTAKCVQYASNGFFILRRSTHWRVVFNGSEPPSCKKVPAGVVQDLLRLKCR
jgi:hypothetical protein